MPSTPGTACPDPLDEPRRRRPPRRRAALAGVALITCMSFAATAQADTQTFTPVADSYVSSSARGTSYGAATTLRVDASPTQRSYLRFNVTLPPGSTITGATLRLFTTSARTGTGFRAYAVASTSWDERTITFDNAPPLGADLGASGGWSTTGYKGVTLPAGSVREGLNSLAATTTSTTSKSFNSREGANRPQLVVTYSPPGPKDTAPPDTTITAQPSDGTTSTDASFSFTSSEPGSRFECALDGAAFAACSSPQPYTGLPAGQHSFGVRAIDSAGNVDPTPATATWTIGAAPAPAPSAACGGMAGPSHISKIVWIWFENKGYQRVTPAAAPYLNRIKAECGYAANYTSVTTCTSLPEYIASTSGSAQGICDNGAPSAHPLDVPNVFRQIDDAGKTWRSYQEGMTSNCLRTGTGRYVPRHNPAVYYVGATGSNSCATSDVPLAGPTFGWDFTIVEPDLCNSMHDCSITTGDTWLAGLLPNILASPDYQAGSTAVFVTFDEGGGAGGEVLFTLALSKYTTPGTVSTQPFNHYSLLRTLQNTLGLPCLAESCNAADMAPAFGMR